jgi:hypothetical protein
LRLGKLDEFLKWSDKYQYILKDEQTEYWLPGEYCLLPKSFLLFVDLLKGDTHETRVLQLSRELSKMSRAARPKWLVKAWLKCVRNRIPFGKRLQSWIMLRLR